MSYGAEMTENAENLTFFDIAIQEKNAEVGYAVVRHERYGRIMIWTLSLYDMSRCIRKPTICICENKDADQLCSVCTADQRLYFRYTDSIVPLLNKYEVSSF